MTKTILPILLGAVALAGCGSPDQTATKAEDDAFRHPSKTRPSNIPAPTGPPTAAGGAPAGTTG